MQVSFKTENCVHMSFDRVRLTGLNSAPYLNGQEVRPPGLSRMYAIGGQSVLASTKSSIHLSHWVNIYAPHCDDNTYTPDDQVMWISILPGAGPWQAGVLKGRDPANPQRFIVTVLADCKEVSVKPENFERIPR